MPLRTTLRQLELLRARLERSRARRADPWELTALQLAHDRLMAKAVAEQDDPEDDSGVDLPPRMAVAATPVPLTRARRPGVGR